MLSMGEGGTTTPRIYARTSGARRPGSPLHPAGFVRSVSPPKSPEAAPVLTPEGRRRVYWRGIAAERQPGSALHPESPRLSRSVSPMPRGRGGGGLPEATLERGGSLPGRNGSEESGGQRYYTSWGARKPGSPIHLSPPRMEGSGVSFPRALHWKPISSCLLKVSHHPHKHATLWPVTYARMCLNAYTKANTGMTSRTPEIGGNGGRKSHVQAHWCPCAWIKPRHAKILSEPIAEVAQLAEAPSGRSRRNRRWRRRGHSECSGSRWVWQETVLA